MAIDLRKKNLLSEGKTKQIYSLGDDDNCVAIRSKDDITAGDGAKHDIMPGKAALATETTCNVFSLLKNCYIPVAFQTQHDATTFIADRCDMVAYEVVVRREAHGSMLKRHPYLEKGQFFPKLLVEFFLKTSNREWNGRSIPCDDPLIKFEENGARLFVPNQPIHGQESFLILDNYPLKGGLERPSFYFMKEVASKTFLVLEKAWQLQGRKLVDMKVEFGMSKVDHKTPNNLVLADVIDNDSWRLVYNDSYEDKQLYRDNGNLGEVAIRYRCVCELSRRFEIPKQQIIIWRGSENDELKPYKDAFDNGGFGLVFLTHIACSMHKKPVEGYQLLAKWVQDFPDSVVIAAIGRSNGAGPMIAANSSVPVITVPVGYKDFPNDAWSSLRALSDVPVMTVLDPANAMQAAFRILSARNPALYANVRYDLEKRLTNVVQIS